MKKVIIAALALTSIALAQGVAPKAAELLEKARATHGGANLENLKTYQEVADLKYFDAKGQVAAALRATVKMDFAMERTRLELYQADKLVTIQQYDPKGAMAWTPQSGTVKLPKAEAESIRASLYQGIPGLKYGKNRDTASSDSNKKWLELQGDVVAVTTKGVKTEYLMDANGAVLAERSEADQIGMLISVYSDVREVGGIKIPHAGKIYAEAAKNALFAETKTMDLKVNPAFTVKDFEMPK